MNPHLTTRLTRALRRRVRRWAFARAPESRREITLQRGQIYILPTRAGAGFGAICFLLLLGAMNYSNSLVFVLCFLLIGLGLVAMQQTHRNLLGLTLSSGPAPPVFAGEPARFSVRIDNPGRLARHAVGVHLLDAQTGGWQDLPPAQETQTHLHCDTRERGWQTLPRLLVSTRFPFGLFTAWSYAHLEARVLVYPAPADNRRQPPSASGRNHSGVMSASGQEDYAGLRAYQPGDSPRHIHWRLYPHHDALLVKQFADHYSEELWLDWSRLQGLPEEARLRRLCRWVVEAHRSGQTYGLRMPAVTLPPARGEAHKHRCLGTLALHPA